MNQKVFKRRVYITGILLIIILILFIFKLFSLHFSSKIVVPANNKYDTHRGYIKDRNGYILAISIELYSLFCNPEEIDKPSDVAQALSPIIDVPYDTLLKRLTKSKRFIWLKRKLDDEKSESIRKLGIKGLYLRKEYKRVYPHDKLASNIIGFVGMDNTGLEGIEYLYDSVLSGRDKDGFFSGTENGIAFGKNITLTIDRFVQYISEKNIEEAVQTYKAKQGAVVVLQVKTGRILAIAKYPNFNPNYYYNYSSFMRRNFTFIDSFEPGSTLKIISLATMLENNPSILNSKYTCKGSIDISDITINCTHVHGTINMHDIIKHSCNIGVIKAMKKIKKADFHKTLKKFGFGTKLGVDLPGETDGILRSPDKWSGVSKYSMAIGHELSVTSVQMVAAFGAIANDGVYLVPYIIESIEDQDGSTLRSFSAQTKGRIINKNITVQLMQMMRGVVKDGTGNNASSVYYEVVGKTGTSKKFFKGHGYSDKLVSSFIGIAPYRNPEICILVVIDDPVEKLSGGQIAAPVFKNIIDRVLPQQGINNKAMLAKLPLKSIKKIIKFDGKAIPDFRGLRLPEAIKLLIEMQKEYELTYSISGIGNVYAQKPIPGEIIKKNEKIILYLK